MILCLTSIGVTIFYLFGNNLAINVPILSNQIEFYLIPLTAINILNEAQFLNSSDER